ncbi:chaperone protein AfaB [Salmonella enterica subsp. salamae serovar 13,22:z:-]|nr:chaperone protein AfaB [Salmonella enterica subsp. salamae serovar 13,22:z:-]
MRYLCRREIKLNKLRLDTYLNIKTVLTIGILAGVLLPGAVAARNNEGIEVTTKVFSLHLGSSRVIYNPASSGSSLKVINDQDYPMLVQSEVLAEDQKTRAPFVVTPPLFRLDGLQSSRLRIVRTGGDFPEARESLQWLCVQGIPPKDGDKWAEDKNKKADKVLLQSQLSVNTCIKLFVRPSSLKGHPDDVAGKVIWRKTGNKLEGTNPTPFYMNLAELSVGGKKLDDIHHIPPYSSFKYKIPAGAGGKIQWKVITDYGGKSKQFELELKN